MTDAEGFVVMFNELSPRVFAYARRHGSQALAQDIVSETFLIAWARRSQIPAVPLPWLFTVARNVMFNHGKRERRRANLVEMLGRLDSVAAIADGADDIAIDRYRFLRALADLRPDDREALLLVGWDGLTADEGAAVMGCSPRAFTVRLSRARERLRQLLDLENEKVNSGGAPA